MGLTPPHLRGQIFLSILGVVIRIGLVCFNSLFLSLDHWRSTQAGVRDREISLSLSFPACLLTPRITGRLVTIKSFGRSSQAGVRDRERSLALSFPACLLTPRITGRLMTLNHLGEVLRQA